MKDIKPIIKFSFESKNYQVHVSACDVNAILLPDGRTIAAGYWKEIYPQQPVDLQVVDSNSKAVPATEV